MRESLGWRWTVALALLALALRGGAVIGLGSWNHGVATAHAEHASIARNLAIGNGFRYNFLGREEILSSHQAPLVPFVLAGSYKLFGVESHAAFIAVLSLQCLISALLVPVVATITLHLFGRRTALVAGLWATFYPPFIAACLHVQAVGWNLWWLALIVLGTLWLRTEDRSKAGGWIFVIGSIGAMLTDPVYALSIGLLIALLAYDALWSPKRWRQGRQVAIIAAAIALGLTPWLVRNYAVHGRFVLVKDTFFFVLWQGNNAISQGTDKLLTRSEDAARLQDLWDPRAANAGAFQSRQRAISVNTCLTPAMTSELADLPTEIERMDWFRALILKELSQNPLHYWRMCGKRLWYWIGFDATNPRSYLWHYRISYLTLVAFALVGISSVHDRWIRCAPLWLSLAGISAVHVLVITSARFRIPAELLLLPLAAAGTVQVRLWLEAALFSKLPAFSSFSRFAIGSHCRFNPALPQNPMIRDIQQSRQIRYSAANRNSDTPADAGKLAALDRDSAKPS